MSLSFYGKRPGPGMRLDKLSLQFALHDTGLISDVAEQVAAMQAALPRSLDGAPVELRVRFVKVVIMTAHGPLLSADQDDKPE